MLKLRLPSLKYGLLLLIPMGLFAATPEPTYTIQKYKCKNGKSLGLITIQPESSVTMMVHYCAYSQLDGKTPEQKVRDACQNDKTEWAVQCFNKEFAILCEDRDHRIKLDCLK